MSNIGILSIGCYLPSEIRSNSSWPDRVIASWGTRTVFDMSDVGAQPSAGSRDIAAAIAASGRDPFRGSRQRRRLAESFAPSYMQVRAAEDALHTAAIPLDAIDFVIEDSMIPDRLTVPNACTVHHALGLREQVLAVSTASGCNAFATHLELAYALHASGRFRYGLLLQGSALSRIISDEASYSPLFGDGATAIVVGPVPCGYGFQASAHRADGSLDNAMSAGTTGPLWYANEPITWRPESVAATRRMLLQLADQASQVTAEALDSAEISAAAVDFYASHQATSWFRRLTQKHAGLASARSLDTFRWTGNLCGANIPFVLATAIKEGMLHDGDFVVTFSGGAGITWSSVVLRWHAPKVSMYQGDICRSIVNRL